MEIVLGLIALAGVGYWLYRSNKQETPSQLDVEVKAEAPYKVEPPKAEEVAACCAGNTVPTLTAVVEAAPAAPEKKARKPRAAKTSEKAAKPAKADKAAKKPRAAKSKKA